jgi:hypothetical protein
MHNRSQAQLEQEVKRVTEVTEATREKEVRKEKL